MNIPTTKAAILSMIRNLHDAGYTYKEIDDMIGWDLRSYKIVNGR